MKYSDWKPEVHTVKDDPLIELTYAWGALTKGLGAAHQPNRCDVGQDLFDAYKKSTMSLTRYPVRESPANAPVKSLCFKSLRMYSTGKPDWDYSFSRE